MPTVYHLEASPAEMQSGPMTPDDPFGINGVWTHKTRCGLWVPLAATTRDPAAATCPACLEGDPR